MNQIVYLCTKSKTKSRIRARPQQFCVLPLHSAKNMENTLINTNNE